MPGPADFAIAATVVGLRILVPLLIPRVPLPGIVAALVLDAIDQSVFQSFTSLNLAGYQGYDKALDTYYLTVAYLATFRTWYSTDAFAVSQFLYAVRLVGVTLFELLQLRWLLFVFPNAFEYFFIFYETVRTRWNPLRLARHASIVAAAVIWIAIKLPQEWFIHLARLDATDQLKRLLGAPIDAPWSEAIAANIPAAIAVVVLVALAIGGARWAILRYAPPPDWPFTVDAEAHRPDVTDEEARIAARARANTLVDRELAAKIVLVSLVSIVFAQVLPGVRATPGQLAMGVAFVVVVNTAFSESLLRRGFSWSSSAREFGAMAAVNLLTAVGFELFFPVSLGAIDLGHTAFFVLLLTLIVTLYDRYRPYYLARVARGKAAAVAARSAAGSRA